MHATFEILKPGLFTIVVDLGRWGYQRYGLSPSGAMDPFSHRVANRLVGNDDRAATLECMILGPSIRVIGRTVMAFAGGDLGPRINEQPVPMWESMGVGEGSVISFGSCRSGCRAYIAATGGINVPEVAGSRATHLPAKLGGYKGRAVQRGDLLATVGGPGGHDSKAEVRFLPQAQIPDFPPNPTVRALLGPQADLFAEEQIERFFSTDYRVSSESDRMGVRLEGEPLGTSVSGEMVSDAAPFGSVQVAAGGQPIILMVDRPTTGGYPKIASVATIDLPTVAQLKPGERVRFVRCTLEQAVSWLRASEEASRTSVVRGC